MKKTHGLDDREMELVKLLMADCQTTGDIQAKLKKLFAGTIEQMLEAEMDEHLGYEKTLLSATIPETAEMDMSEQSMLLSRAIRWKASLHHRLQQVQTSMRL